MSTFNDPHVATSMSLSQNEWASKADWTRHKDLIRDLYLVNTLPKVMEVMARDQGFQATLASLCVSLSFLILTTPSEKMYKTHFKLWGLYKYNKESEMRAIVHRHFDHVSNGKACTTRIRGRPIKYAEVARYWRRKGVSIEEITAQRATSKTPEAVEQFTPLSAPPRDPWELTMPEGILIAVQDYHNVKLKSWAEPVRTWDPSLRFMFKKSQLACSLFSKHEYQTAGDALIKSSRPIKAIVLTELPSTFLQLFVVILAILPYGRTEIAISIIRQCSSMAELLLDKRHPFLIVCAQLVRVDQKTHSHFANVVEISLRKIIDCFEGHFGASHEVTNDARIKASSSAGGAKNHEHRQSTLINVLRGCDSFETQDDERTLKSFLGSAHKCLTNAKPVEAKGWAEAVIERAKTKLLLVLGLDTLAACEYALDEPLAAEEHMRQAIELAIATWGCHADEVQLMMLDLEYWLAEQGEHDSAAKLREERMRYQEPVELL